MGGYGPVRVAGALYKKDSDGGIWEKGGMKIYERLPGRKKYIEINNK